MLESLAESAGEAGELVREHLPAMLETFKVLLTESLERRAERNKRAGTDDFDEEEMQALEEEQEAEDEVFDQFAECVGSLLKSFHGAILPSLQARFLRRTLQRSLQRLRSRVEFVHQSKALSVV